ncbi:hypothetical protein JAAARDRAFT_89952, partial [Jaapia argillacea MUCL 33604]
CYEDTRQSILDEIEAWAQSDHTLQSPIAYLPGVAGLGKTTVSHSVARTLHHRNLLGASFFFARDVQGRSGLQNVCATIAYHLAHRHPSYKTNLCNVLREPVPSSCARQFQELLLDPLLKSKAPLNPLVIVFDALDEC